MTTTITTIKQEPKVGLSEEQEASLNSIDRVVSNLQATQEDIQNLSLGSAILDKAKKFAGEFDRNQLFMVIIIVKVAILFSATLLPLVPAPYLAAALGALLALLLAALLGYTGYKMIQSKIAE